MLLALNNFDALDKKKIKQFETLHQALSSLDYNYGGKYHTIGVAK